MSVSPPGTDTALPPDFGQRLELSLTAADRERRRRMWYRRVVGLMPIVLLIGPIIAWRLMLATPDGVHVCIAALAWVTFLLDVGVHVDNSLLAYLGLTQLPTIVGVVILTVLTCWLLSDPGEDT